MNKKASKWMIGALALAVLVPTAAFAATTPQSGAKMTAQVKTENGVTFYSTDNGKTWSKVSPISTEQAIKYSMGKDGIATIESTDHLDPTAEGVTDAERVIDAPGFINSQQDGFENGSVGDKDSSVDMMIKSEKGVTFYSTDKGKTWSKAEPDGVISAEQDSKIKGSMGKDGITTIDSGLGNKDRLGDKDSSVELMIKSEKGVTFYSTDKGKTWNKFLLPNPEVKTK
ncbi:hypothetical protein C2W64_01981 [Brevibacillus laterosporus]|nr:sialidase family protein [Brevibacillus laterosporus]RAP26306.1 hypothetical protein C2W64_01981 [Brevibacillus laterosporus]